MKILLAVTLTAVILSAVPTAFAVPNIWHSGFGMGMSEYIITSPQHTGLNISCTSNPDENQVLQHSVLVTLPDGRTLSSQDDGTAITLVTGGEQYGVPASWAGVMGIMPGYHSLMLSKKQHHLKSGLTTKK